MTQQERYARINLYQKFGDTKNGIEAEDWEELDQALNWATGMTREQITMTAGVECTVSNPTGESPSPQRTPKPTRSPSTASEKPESEEDVKPFFSGKRFLPIGMVNYLESQGLHVISLKHEDFVRIYTNGIYVEDQGEILNAMTTALGEQGFKMSYYNEVMDYYQKRITQRGEVEHDGLLNVKNGFLNLETMELEKHSPERKSIIQLPVEFDKSAEPTEIDKWLSDCLEADTEQIKLFYEAVGYTLLQTTELQKMFFLLGPTQTGKSTAIHIIKGLLGHANCADVELAPIEDESDRFSRALLYGKIANFSCDISPRYLTGDGNVKKVIAGDGITGEHKFRAAFSFEPDCTLWAAANALPGSGDKSGAWYEKMVILRFEKQFLSDGENKPDRQLKHTLTEPSQLSGLLSYAISYGKEALRRGRFTVSERNNEAIEEYKLLNDHVLQFVESLADVINTWDDDEFYREIYKDWCEEQGIKPLSKANLANATKRHGIKRLRIRQDESRVFVWEREQKT